jgi:hypothetical protein
MREDVALAALIEGHSCRSAEGSLSGSGFDRVDAFGPLPSGFAGFLAGLRKAHIRKGPEAHPSLPTVDREAVKP